MIYLSNTDTKALCRYLSDAAKLYRRNASCTSSANRARLVSIIHDKLALKLISSQCEQIKEQLEEINYA